ncbi:hypothetical protein TCAL_16828 [Tigriopus californicus]|uniref:F-box domain-containing protein n=1 Tax=Tigriopus californicus TaxID=6832 RepID=A0A553PA24_TIGCA|nr:hypothetical protein TCAL_16828 [Tigriopus californicus]
MLPNDIHFEIIHRIRSTKDLLALMRTSKAFHSLTVAYIEHYCATDNRLEKVGIFMQMKPLLIQELALKQKMLKNPGQTTLLQFKAVRWFQGDDPTGEIIDRVLVAQIQSFAHKDNSNYFQVIHDETLNRQIVHLHTVCWLHFEHTFRDLPPGRYQCSLRMRATPQLNWSTFGASQPPGSIEVRQITQTHGSPEVLVSQAMQANWWSQIRARQFDGSNLENATLHFESGTSWFHVTLTPFQLERCSDILFQFRDVDHPFWKSGLDWDFIELRKLSKFRNQSFYPKLQRKPLAFVDKTE